MQPLRYRVHGMVLEMDRPLPAGWGQPVPDTGMEPATAPTLRIDYAGRCPPHQLPSSAQHGWNMRDLSEMAGAQGPGNVSLWSRDTSGVRHWLVRFSRDDPAEVLIDPARRRVAIQWSHPDAPTNPDTLPDDMASLLCPIIGLFARLNGGIALHCSAIAANGRALLFAGPSGAGKSTLLASFAAAQCAPIADDQIIPERSDARWSVYPGFCRPRLHETTIRHFVLDDQAEARVFSNATKRYVRLPSTLALNDGSEPLPIAGLFLLAPRAAVGGAEIRVERIGQRESFAALWENLYPAFLAIDQAERARTFTLLADFARHTPTFRLHRPDDLTRLDDVRQAILSAIAQ